MSVTADTLRLHLDYSNWATRKLLTAAAALPPEHLEHDFGAADRSIVGTLAHTFAADRVWLARVTGGPIPTFLTDADRSLAALQLAWPPLLDSWKQWAAGLTDENVRMEITYRDLKGNQWTQTLWKLLLHVVNHGTHHRGQVSGFLRSLGHTPPATDLLYYHREVG
jgi:uncharacterized damage-inducible protein DinB